LHVCLPRVYKTYGTEAIARVQENPYRLALDIHGIGFKTAETLAQRLGIPRDAVIRAQAGVRHALQTFADEGHCAVVQAELLEAAMTLLEIPETVIAQAITLEVQEERLIAEAIDDQPCLMLAPLYRAEVGVATQLLHLLDGAPPWGTLDPAKMIPWVEGRTGQTLAASQRAAVAQVLTGKVTVITGGSGVGKTTIVTSIKSGKEPELYGKAPQSLRQRNAIRHHHAAGRESNCCLKRSGADCRAIACARRCASRAAIPKPMRHQNQIPPCGPSRNTSTDALTIKASQKASTQRLTRAHHACRLRRARKYALARDHANVPCNKTQNTNPGTPARASTVIWMLCGLRFGRISLGP
jgi:hypothetical protein